VLGGLGLGRLGGVGEGGLEPKAEAPEDVRKAQKKRELEKRSVLGVGFLIQLLRQYCLITEIIALFPLILKRMEFGKIQ